MGLGLEFWATEYNPPPPPPLNQHATFILHIIL